MGTTLGDSPMARTRDERLANTFATSIWHEVPIYGDNDRGHFAVPRQPRVLHQRQLADAIIALGGSYQRVPRDLPAWLRTLMGEERALRVDHVFLPTSLYPEVGDDNNYRLPHYMFPLGANPPSEYRAPFKFSLPAELVTVFQMPAMDQVTNLHLFGSSVTDDVIPALTALPALRSLTLTGTLLSDHGFDKLNRDLTSRGAGLTFPVPRTRSTLWTKLTADLTVFARAERGELKAVEELISLVAGRPVLDASSRPYDAIVELLSTIPNQQAMDVLHQKVDDDDPSVRLLAVTCLGVRGETRHIQTTVCDSDPGVRREAMKQALGLLNDDTLFPLLVWRLAHHIRTCGMRQSAHLTDSEVTSKSTFVMCSGR